MNGLAIAALHGPVDAVVTLPGSKSLTNRALLAAGLATGTSHLTGVLDADDSAAMLDVVAAIGARVRGDTATGANKLVTTETGLKVQVPLFVNVGDTIKVNTETGAYLTRV